MGGGVWQPLVELCRVALWGLRVAGTNRGAAPEMDDRGRRRCSFIVTEERQRLQPDLPASKGYGGIGPPATLPLLTDGRASPVVVAFSNLARWRSRRNPAEFYRGLLGHP